MKNISLLLLLILFCSCKDEDELLVGTWVEGSQVLTISSGSSVTYTGYIHWGGQGQTKLGPIMGTWRTSNGITLITLEGEATQTTMVNGQDQVANGPCKEIWRVGSVTRKKLTFLSKTLSPSCFLGSPASFSRK